MPDVVVIGAGISGLTCAWSLQKMGIDVLVVEAANRAGGVIATHHVDDYLIEAGPNSILPTPLAADIITRLGLGGEILAAQPRSPRFIYLGGRLRKVPWVLSPGGLLRALIEPGIPRSRGNGDESVASFFSRRFGRQVHERLVAPFVSGIYAGDTQALGVEAAFPRLRDYEQRYGSVVVGVLRSGRTRPRPLLSSFKKGMEMLPRALAQDLQVRYGVGDARIRSGGRVEIGTQSIQTKAVVVAAPAYAAAELVGDVDSELARLLSSVAYAPIVVAASSVRRTQQRIPLNGFGFLVPRSEGMRTLGTLFNSSIFPDRAPEGWDLMTTFLGGIQDPAVVGWSDDQVWTTVGAELQRVLKFDGNARYLRLFRYLKAIPQYGLGHAVWKDRVKERLGGLTGLFLAGNYLDGVSVPLSMEQGQRVAARVARFVQEG